MAKSPSLKRQEVMETFAVHYPRPIAELVAVLAQPFDDGEGVDEATLRAHQATRREVRELFAQGDEPPSGGQIETRLCGIARRLLDTLEQDDAATLATERVSASLSRLSDVILSPTRIASAELCVPESVKRLDGTVPFAMWR